MPPRRISTDRATRELSRIALALLTDDDTVEPVTDQERWEEFRLAHIEHGHINYTGPSLEELWRAHEADLLRSWIAAHPGTRPRAWWTWSGPEAKPGLTIAHARYGGGWVPAKADQPGILAEAGLLTPAEKRRLGKCT